MEISDWITLAAILVALGIGVSSLIQTERLQKRERKERLLNEIIEWAVANIQATYGQDITVVTLKGDELRSALYLGFVQLNSRSQYIKRAASIFNDVITKLVNETVETLESCENVHAEWVSCTEKEKDKKMEETLAVCKSLREKAKAIIEEAAKIKNKDII